MGDIFAQEDMELLVKAEELYDLHPTNPAVRKVLANVYSIIIERRFGGAIATPLPGYLKRMLALINNLYVLRDALPPGRIIELFYRRALLLHLLGLEKESLEAIQSALDAAEESARSHPLASTGIRFFQTRSGTLTQFGHLCSEVDTFIKMKEMGWLPRNMVPMLRVPQGKVANPTLLECWRKHICVVTEPTLCERLESLQGDLEYNSYWVRLPNRPLEYGHHSFSVVQGEWEKAGRTTVLQLSSAHIEEGEAYLRSVGVGPDDWFVTLHVRSYEQPNESNEFRTHPSRCRDANLMSYCSAVDEILARGGKVFRLGDPTMEPIPQKPGVVDYAHSAERRPMLDLFLLARSRFLIGTPSGPPGVATALGTPVVFTNVVAFNIYPQSTRDIYLPKLLRNVGEKAYLDFETCMTPPLRNLFNSEIYDQLGIEHAANKAEDIRDAVVEMIERLDGTYVESSEDEELQRQFVALAERHEPGAMVGRIGARFLRRHSNLLRRIDEGFPHRANGVPPQSQIERMEIGPHE